jgi:hypothetical protein
LNKPSLFLGFDFYGAGNIGDDLMLEGFLGGFTPSSDAELTAALPSERVANQQKRFPRVRWHCLSTEARTQAVLKSNCWVGLGGTPFQATHGPWLLNRILADFESAPRTRKFMVGVGCEEEVLRERALAERIVRGTEFIWTRDEASREILLHELGAQPEQVSCGGDLANIALKRIFGASESERTEPGSLGIVYFAGPDDAHDLKALKRFVQSFPSETRPAFVANEVRERGFEQAAYKRMFGTWSRLVGKSPRFLSPDYERGSVEDLISHYPAFDVVMACRYHALLTAAWAGCRVAALDRSSKIRFLAAELGIPLVASPFTVASLREGFVDARKVPRHILESKCAAAERAVLEFSQAL